MMNNDRTKIGTFDLLGMFWRAFFIQASWSFERMQALGFAYALEPVIRKLYPNNDAYEARLSLHLEYFNTQPYLASFILGACARLEQDRASGLNPSADTSGLKSALMASLGALGDSFFWGALKPLCAAIAVAALLGGVWWAPFLYLVLYNIWHVGLRAGVLYWGFQSSGNPVLLLSRFNFPRMARRFKAITLSVVGGVLGALFFHRPELRPAASSALITAISGFSLSLALVAVLRRGGSPVKLMLGLAGVCLLLAYSGVV